MFFTATNVAHEQPKGYPAFLSSLFKNALVGALLVRPPAPVGVPYLLDCVPSFWTGALFLDWESRQGTRKPASRKRKWQNGIVLSLRFLADRSPRSWNIVVRVQN